MARCLISIATDVSLQECWLPADITPGNSIEISALGPIFDNPRIAGSVRASNQGATKWTKRTQENDLE